MVNLALLLASKEATASYSRAGMIAGAYVVALTLAYPVWGRISVRSGFRRTLVLAASLQSTAFAIFCVTAAVKGPAMFLLVSALGAGACVPPSSAVANTVFTAPTYPDEARQTIFALSSMLTESVFIIGPLLVAGIVTVLSPIYAVALTAVISAAGALWLSVTPPVKNLDGNRIAVSGRSRLIENWRQLHILIVAALGAISLGALDVTVVARASALDTSAGILLAIVASGGVLGSLFCGSVRLPGSVRLQLFVALLTFGVAGTPLIAQPGIVISILVLALIGLANGPADAFVTAIVGTESVPGARSQAFTLLVTANWIGFGIGNSIAGYAVQRASAGMSAVVIVGGAVAAAMLVLLYAALAPSPRGDRDDAVPPVSPALSGSSGTPGGAKPSTCP
jgi:predicted MFS family arabinose efflux permease